MVDGVADGPELGRGHHLALHQATGGIFLIAERGLDRRAIGLGHGGQHPLALVVLEVVHHGGGIVGIEFLQGLGQDQVRNAFQHLLADAVIQFREGFRQQLGRQPQHHDAAMFGCQEPHQIGDVGRMEVLEQGAQSLAVAVVSGIDDLFDEGGRQDVVLIKGRMVLDKAVTALDPAQGGGVRVLHVSASLIGTA